MSIIYNTLDGQDFLQYYPFSTGFRSEIVLE